ncbi:NADH-quinone oxidoreductase subunit H [Aminithiophilus ramosus]|uniref:NADH-quinone oxidoreductase subunit H n=1 Tax=Aminithiophilus ramosus TaxID=3029084 RepID=A0A9Q7ADC8_9BACT|nr:NADH-quinone oxidoreductase subunit H [Aminithiophilus ramosus]QTX32294.1 NADH-quinone oxidoreductase subunit H [Aminithiophilus ramosus]
MTSWLFPLAAWLAAPLLPGLIYRVKARFAGRRGTSAVQLYRDMAKLFRKGVVVSDVSCGLVRLAPLCSLGALLTASLFLPWGGMAGPLSFRGDWVFLAYLLGLSRFVTVLGALDTGSSFEGMGASREVLLALFVEPSLFLGMAALLPSSGEGTLASLFAPGQGAALGLLVASSWFVALLAENARIPVDDPKTHLELTMIHEVMILDSSGPDLALIHYAGALKLWLFSALVADLLLASLPVDGALRLGLFPLLVAATVLAVGLVESTMARLRLNQVPKLLLGAGALAVVALLLKLTGERL